MIILLVIISLSVLILIHELGHFLAARFFKVRVDEFGLGFPPRVFGKKIGETIYSVNALPFGGFVKIHGEDGDSLSAPDPRNFSSQPAFKKSVIILAGILMNIVLGWLVFSAVFMMGAPKHLVIGGVAPDSPADIAGISTGSVILKLETGSNVLLDPIQSDEFIEKIKEAAGKEINLSIEKEGKVREVILKGRLNPPEGQGALGINLLEVGFPKTSPLKAFLKGAIATGETLYLVARSFADLFIGAFSNLGVFKTVAGPVGIVSVAAETTSLGIPYFLELMALISLNLAVLNLIPFPALDGGRFLMIMIERIKGSPISRKAQLIVNGVGFLILITLMIVVTIQDVGRL